MSSQLGRLAPEPSASVRAPGRQGAHVVEMQRRRLLLAIGEIVAEKGLEEASVGRVCKRAGVSRRTFYDLFEDREACLLAAFEQAIESIESAVAPVFQCEDKWSARIRAGLVALLELFDSNPGIARLCVVETLRVGEEVSERRKQVLDRMTTAIDDGRSESTQSAVLSPVAAQGVLGGVLAVIHARLLEDDGRPLLELLNPLMGMIVQPYLGAAGARRELDRPDPTSPDTPANGLRDPFKGLSIRFTYRTARVLATIATHPGASNRVIADTAGVVDEGQMSRLLTRLQRAGLVENRGEGQPRGEPNAWKLTERGEAVHVALGVKEADTG
jgi:AcrR family transcriptional regulator